VWKEESKNTRPGQRDTRQTDRQTYGCGRGVGSFGIIHSLTTKRGPSIIICHGCIHAFIQEKGREGRRERQAGRQAERAKHDSTRVTLSFDAF